MVEPRPKPKTWTEMAELLIDLSKSPQQNGDTVLSLACAIKAAECLQIARNLDVKIGEVCPPPLTSAEGD